MTPQEFKQLRQTLELSIQGCADALGLAPHPSGGRQVRRWEAGSHDVPMFAASGLERRRWMPEYALMKLDDAGYDETVLIRLHPPAFIVGHCVGTDDSILWIDKPPHDIGVIADLLLAANEWMGEEEA